MHSRNFTSFNVFLDTVISKQSAVDHRYDAFSFILPEGLMLEFGVATGTSINEIATAYPNRTIHGFDSFEGLPEYWRPEHDKGRFKCDIPFVRSNVLLYKGLFNETLPGFLESNPGPIAFLHMDADLYSSTAYVFEQVQHRLVDGTIIVFDELYYNHDSYKEHEYKAFAELIERTGYGAQFLHRRHQWSFCFRITI